MKGYLDFAALVEKTARGTYERPSRHGKEFHFAKEEESTHIASASREPEIRTRRRWG